MKNLRTRTILAAFLTSLLVEPLLAETNSWSLLLEPSPAVWAKSDPNKLLTINLKNITQRDVWVYETNPLNDYFLRMEHADGADVSMTAEGRRIQLAQRRVILRSGRFPVHPGGSYSVQVKLADLYDLSPGKYILHVELRTYEQDMYYEPTGQRLPETEYTIPSAFTHISITP